MTIKIQGDKITFPDDSEQTTAYNGSSGGGIPEAPVDGKQYGRQDATWTEVTGGGSTTPTKTYVGALTEPKILPSTSEIDYRVVPFTGDGWVDGKFTADTKGSYALNVGLSWSIINPIADQIFRRCVLFVNNAIVSTKSHGIDEMYPHGSKNESNWVVDLEAGDEVEVKALQQNAQSQEQNVANNKETYVRIAMLGGSGTGGESGGTTNILPVLYSGQIWSTGFINYGTGFTASKIADGQLRVTFDTPLPNNEYVAVANINSSTSKTASVINQTESSFDIYTFTTSTGTPVLGNVEFTVTGTETIAVGGGSGGGTAEPMVWENKKAERAYDTVYTNTKDCPIYVQPYLERNSTERMYVQFKIDGDLIFTEGGESISFDSPMFVVPSGSTYELVNQVPGTALVEWFEANVSGGASSGGGSYTPEPMVWEDKLAERDMDVEYTNSYDTPLLLSIGVYTAGTNGYATMLIDGANFGAIGHAESDNTTYDVVSFTVPSGSKYKLSKGLYGIANKASWHEAKMPVAVGSGGTPSSFARIVDRKPATEAGGASVAGTQSRTLNTIEYDNDNIVTLDGNDVSFTLQAGTYVINYSAPANKVGAHNVSLYDLTDNQFVNTGTVNYSLDNASNTSYGNYSVTLTEPHSYKVSHYTEEAKSNGLGNLNPVNDGIFTTVDIQKVGTVGSGDSIWTEESGTATYDGKVSVAKDLIVANDGFGISWGRSNGSPRIYAEEDGELNIRHGGGSPAITVDSNGTVKFGTNMTVGNTGVISAQGINDTTTNALASNVCVDGSGVLRRSTVATYSVEEVDKKLAIKDKLIEKLSARLDELEKKVK